MGILLKPFAAVLLILYNFVNNYGIALFLFAIFVKVILFPFSLKGKKGMIKMNMISGKAQKLQKMYANNPTRYNEELQKLYQEEGVNPTGGCLWSLLPLVVLIPLYGVIRQPLQYMMNMTPEQIASMANALNWETVAVNMGWIKEAASFAESSGAYNELYLAGMINQSNLAAAQAAAGEGAKVIAMNFNFLGMDLSQVPTWKFWSNGLDWSTIGLFLLVIVSAISGFISSKVMMKTNEMSGQGNAQSNQTNKTMTWMMPIMSLWIGFSMPGLLNIYWVANNILGMAQELISAKILKKDYEEAARVAAENAAKAKEEEKQRKRELAEKRAKEAEEAKKNKKLAAELKAAEDKGDSGVIPVSRVGMRSYARGRAYDPERFGGVTPYKDPDVLIKELEEAAQAAEAAKKNKKDKKSKKQAEEIVTEKPAEVTKPVEEQVTAPVEEEVAAPVSEEAVEEAVESVVEETVDKE